MSQRRNSKGRQTQTNGESTSASVSRRAQRRIEEERKRRRQRLMMVGGAVVLAVVIVGALILINRPDDDGDDASDLAVTVPPPLEASIPQDGRTFGNADAPVTIVEYADFQCPGCGGFARDIKPQLIQDYIATGQAKLEFHDFPFLDDRQDTSESDDASEAAFCAQNQGQFWAYEEMLFHNQSGENEGAFARERLIEMARNVDGLDVDQFRTCIDGDEFEDDVQTMYDESVDAGIQQTPTFVVNGQTVTGGNYAQLREAIEAALAS